MAATEIQQGKAKIFGFAASAGQNATMVTLTGAATITMESADISDDHELAPIKGQTGETECLIASNRTRSITIEFAPNGATRAAAITSCANSQPAKITKVVLSEFITTTDTLYNGNWNCLGYSIKMSRDGQVMMTLKLKAYIQNRASLTAGVIVG